MHLNRDSEQKQNNLVASTGARSIPVLLSCDNSQPGEQKPPLGHHYAAALWFYHCLAALEDS